MSAPANEDIRELERLLVVAADLGEARSEASLREELGLGAHDLQSVLGLLREHGKAFEETPGEWRGPLMDEGANAPVVVSVSDAVDPDASPAAMHAAALEAMAHRGPDMTALPFAPALSAGATVQLTPGVAAALSAEALGAVVKAGIDEAIAAGMPFVLRIG